MKYNYQCIRQYLSSKELGEYVSYGIAVEMTRLFVSDVSCDKNEVLKIVRLLNRHRVSPLHMREVIEDNIGL